MGDIFGCAVKRLAEHQQLDAARLAISINPLNRAPVERLSRFGIVLEPLHAAVLTTRVWPNKGVKLKVGFMGPGRVDAKLIDKVLSHMNAWGTRCNVRFDHSTNSPEVRISFGSGGYWSYLGTDILHIPANQQTMNLEGFSVNSPDSEFHRVIRHETGHTLGMPHEHMRREIVAKLDPAKTVSYFERTQGWSAQEVQQQVLTPLEDSSILGTPHADVTSIMTYQLPGEITVDGQPIPGGTDINEQDFQFMSSIYPQPSGPVSPPVQPPTPPPTGGGNPNIQAALQSLLATGIDPAIFATTLTTLNQLVRSRK